MTTENVSTTVTLVETTAFLASGNVEIFIMHVPENATLTWTKPHINGKYWLCFVWYEMSEKALKEFSLPTFWVSRFVSLNFESGANF